ncbi:MAG TPA: efflux RND transporter permease subunit [Bacteroidales bacterium]|jgi:HAE1 family hydrophobic/amphiphilic exporter-1|nr:efflux RND transporter permease subunit [Bacteroidales bacterium]MDI9532324.1 efflux RND transporter permease subunit [Bacteroidota bacterium]MBP8708494.1 efflux RND transporter permease subunit [Bacteroidales bacterium]HHU99576.1 efflux RND transporter permease subunit [Bacteroidales bacterium]HPA68664.1 efflux RND transporter permease subunit [Bacteroidales bacterium]
MKISEISIKRPIYVIVLFSVLSILGYIGYRNLSAELMPKFTPPVINVQIVYPGASPTEVENSVTRKVEDALSSMEGIDKIQSYSYESLSMLFVTFRYGTDIDKSIADAQNYIDAKRSQLPVSVLSPVISKVTVDDKAIIILSATSDLEATQFYDLMDKRILPQLSGIKGVSKGILIGGLQREIQVNLDATRMRALGVTPAQIQGVIRASNLDFPTGSIRNPETQTAVRLSGKFTDVSEIRNLVVMTTPTGSQIRLQDIAEITDAIKDPSSLARVNGEEAILINIYKQSDANAVDVSNNIRKTIVSLENEFSENGLKMEIAQDSTDFTRESISSVLTDLLLAVLLVSLVMLIFLHNIRNAIVVMIVVPVSLISTFIGMDLFNFSLNLMSLLGLSLVIGILVDDAIVVIENVYRHIEMGKNRVRASWDAIREIGFTVISITIVLVIVFLPIALTETIVSDILRQFCGVIIFSVLVSLLAALTLVPLLTSRYGNIHVLTGKNLYEKFLMWFEKLIESFGAWISGLMQWSLSHKRWLALIILVITVAVFSLFPLGFIGFEFLPAVDRGEFIVQLEMPRDISLEESNALIRKAEDWFRVKPEVTKVVTMVGLTSDNTQSTQGSPYLAELNVKLVPARQREENTRIYIAKIKKPLSDYLVDAKVKIFSVAVTGQAAKAAVEYVITGNDADSVMIFADRALEVMRSIPGTMQQELSVERGTPEINVSVDRDKMSALGLTLDNVGFTMQMTYQGNNSLKYTENNYEYDINIRADKAYREQVDDVSNLTFINSRGEAIRLSQFADISLGTGPGRLERFNRNSSVTIRSQVLGASPGEVSQEFRDRIERMDKPQGTKLIVTGDMRSMSDSMTVMTGALLLSVILIYLSLVVLYNNWTDPFAILFSIPFAVLGAILALAMTNTALSVYGMLGLVMLIGLVGKNAILLVDFANDAIKEGKEINDALIQAVRIRTRPILMTALSTIIGMLPVALSKGSGAELRNGLAWVVIGGMMLSTFLTLIVVPVMYRILHSGQGRRGYRQKVDIERLMVE